MAVNAIKIEKAQMNRAASWRILTTAKEWRVMEDLLLTSKKGPRSFSRLSFKSALSASLELFRQTLYGPACRREVLGGRRDNERLPN